MSKLLVIRHHNLKLNTRHRCVCIVTHSSCQLDALMLSGYSHSKSTCKYFNIRNTKFVPDKLKTIQESKRRKTIQ